MADLKALAEQIVVLTLLEAQELKTLREMADTSFAFGYAQSPRR